ncbi:MAG: hypothetical protein ABF876_16650 [Acetobacter aceti]|uniref:Uncharacterized protein n=1 Tax=Acetobacter aceti TaxID=435 RepID=A0A1U9KEW6_ACEAC|nr:hypothetical protein [Acetobacter aceti]AQS84332.1 hypothetical protein A0U92_05575 [Acetobacter aceti]
MRFFRQSFLVRFSVSALVAGMAAAALSSHALAQEIIRVVDAQGHQIGVLIRTPSGMAEDVASAQSFFENMDRMLAQQMAIMQRSEQHMLEIAHQSPADGVVGGTSYQSVTSISWGGRGTVCSQTITTSQNGESAPVVHVSGTGNGTGCMHDSSASSARSDPSQSAHQQDLIPAVDVGHVEKEPAEKSSSRM